MPTLPFAEEQKVGNCSFPIVATGSTRLCYHPFAEVNMCFCLLVLKEIYHYWTYFHSFQGAFSAHGSAHGLLLNQFLTLANGRCVKEKCLLQELKATKDTSSKRADNSVLGAGFVPSNMGESPFLLGNGPTF